MVASPSKAYHFQSVEHIIIKFEWQDLRFRNIKWLLWIIIMWETLYKSSNSANIYNIQNKSGDTHKIHIMSNFILGHLIQDLLLSFGRKVIWSYDVMTEFRPFNNLSANDFDVDHCNCNMVGWKLVEGRNFGRFYNGTTEVT